MSDESCLHRSKPKVAAAGISIFLLEELGDARLRCAQLKKYIDEVVQLIDDSQQRDHFFEVAGHLIYGIPDTLLRMDKALSAAAMAAAKLDYEETKDELLPEKVDELERVLEEVRVRRVQRRSKEARSNDGLMLGKALEAFRTIVLPVLQYETKDALEQAVTDVMVEFARMRAGNHASFSGKLDRFKPIAELTDSEWVDHVEEAMEMWFSAMKKALSVRQAAENIMKIPEAVAQLEHLAADIEATGAVDSSRLASLISKLEGQYKVASSPVAIAPVLRAISASLLDTSEYQPSRLLLASTLRRVLGETVNTAVLEQLPERAYGALDPALIDKTASSPIVQQMNGAFNEGSKTKGDLKSMKEAAEALCKEAKEAGSTIFQPVLAKTPTGAFSKLSDRIFDLAFEMGAASGTAYPAKKTAGEGEEKLSRFEEGKPADPTDKMSPEDAKEWKQNTEEHKDEFKSASGDAVAEEAKRSRFEEGKPADPTENMDKGDAAKWKQNTEEHKDEFKSAASGDPRWIHAKYPGKTTDGTPFKKGDFVLYYPNTKTFLVGDKAETAWKKFEAEVADEAVYNNSMTASEEVLSRFEEGKPADPTENMSESDAKKWKQETEENKDNFKAASEADRWKAGGFRSSPVAWIEKSGRWISVAQYAGEDEHWTWEILKDGDKFEVLVMAPKLKQMKHKTLFDSLDKAKKFAERFIKDPQGGEKLGPQLNKLFEKA